jgi:hypothetical protein
MDCLVLAEIEECTIQESSIIPYSLEEEEEEEEEKEDILIGDDKKGSCKLPNTDNNSK